MSFFSFNSQYTIGDPKGGNAHKIERWESPVWTPSGGDTSQTWSIPADTFSGPPSNIHVYAELTVADGNYPVGTIISLSETNMAYDRATAGNADFGYTLSFANNNYEEATLVLASDLYGVNLTTFDLFSLQAENCNVWVVMERFVIGDQPDITRVGLVPLERKVVASGDADVQFNLQQWFNEYESFELHCLGVRGVTDATYLAMRTSPDGASFDSGASDYRYQYHRAIGAVVSAAGGLASSFGVGINTSGINSIEYADPVLEIFHAANPGLETTVHIKDAGVDNTPTSYVGIAMGRRASAGETIAIQLFQNSGNLDTGTFILYGKRKVV